MRSVVLAVIALAVVIGCFAAFAGTASATQPVVSDGLSPPVSPGTAETEGAAIFAHHDGWCVDAIGSGLSAGGITSHAFGGWREVWSFAPARIPQALVRKVRVTYVDPNPAANVCVLMGNTPKRWFTSTYALTSIDGGPDLPASPLAEGTTVSHCVPAVGFSDGGPVDSDDTNAAGAPLSLKGQYIEMNVVRDASSTRATLPYARPPYLWIGNGAALAVTGVCIDVWW